MKYSNINNCVAKSCTVNGYLYIGGICGRIENNNANDYNISNCKVEQCTLFSSSGDCGGIFGSVSGSSKNLINISSCISKDSTITTKRGRVGGIIGNAYTINIVKCANYSTIIR